MVRTHRLAAIALLVTFVIAPLRGTLVASEPQLAAVASDAASPDPASLVEPHPLTLGEEIFHAQVAAATGETRWRSTPILFAGDAAFEEQRGGYRGGRGRGGRHDSARAAIALGAIAAVAGTAVLVYANRPECNTTPAASGCGYGTKVVGGAVLTGGVAAVLVGAFTWR